MGTLRLQIVTLAFKIAKHWWYVASWDADLTKAQRERLRASECITEGGGKGERACLSMHSRLHSL